MLLGCLTRFCMRSTAASKADELLYLRGPAELWGRGQTQCVSAEGERGGVREEKQTDRQELTVLGRTVRKGHAEEIFEQRPGGREKGMQLGTEEGHSPASGTPAKPRYRPFPTAPLPKANPALPQRDTHWYHHCPLLWPSAQDIPSICSRAM